MAFDTTGFVLPDLRTLPCADAVPEPVICTCAGLTRGDIERASAALTVDGTAPTPGRVYLFLGKRPACGSCRDVIRDALPQRDDSQAPPILF